MFKRFNTKQLIFIALMSALLFAINFTIGSGIISITGIPASSLFVTGITNLIVLTFVILVLKKLWSLTLLYTLYGILALPTHMAGGPPGFLLKVPIVALSVFTLEITIYLTKFKKYGFFLGLAIFTLIGSALYLTTYYLLGMPEFDKMFKAITPLTIALLILGSLGILIGFTLYNKLKNKRILQQISE